jgi:hypothetical protein
MAKREDFYEFSYTYPYYKKFDDNFTGKGTITMGADVDWKEEYSTYKVAIYFSSTGNVDHGFIPSDIEEKFYTQLRSDLNARGVDLNDVDFDDAELFF